MEKQETKICSFSTATVMPDGIGAFTHCPELLTEDELILFLRIPEISGAKDFHNVIENLKDKRGLPRVHLCNMVLYPLQEVMEWLEKETRNETGWRLSTAALSL